MARTVERPMVWPSLPTLPWMGLWPQRGFSRAKWTISAASSESTEGHPPARYCTKFHVRRISSRC